MKDFFMDIYSNALHFLFVELNQCHWVSDFKKVDENDQRKISVFEYFDLISELFLVSMVDIYSFMSKGLRHIKFINAPPPQSQPQSQKQD